MGNQSVRPSHHVKCKPAQQHLITIFATIPGSPPEQPDPVFRVRHLTPSRFASSLRTFDAATIPSRGFSTLLLQNHTADVTTYHLS
jgi:hypothetical protein